MYCFTVSMAAGIRRLWDRSWLRAAGTVALLAVAITCHGVYNILIFRKTVFGKENN